MDARGKFWHTIFINFNFFLYININYNEKIFYICYLKLIIYLFCIFFSSQNLFVFVVANYFFYINFFWKQKVKIFYITLFNIIFLIFPYFLFENIFFEISKNVTSSRVHFNYFNLIEIFSILLIYILPIYLLNFKLNEIINFFKKNYIFLGIIFVIFIFIFFDYESEFLGGGAIKKIIFFSFW